MAISRFTLPLASEKLRPIAEKTVRPSTSMACGTYAMRPASRKKSMSAIAIETNVVMPINRVDSHGETYDPSAIETNVTTESKLKPIHAHSAENVSHSATMMLAPSKPQNRDLTAR